MARNSLLCAVKKLLTHLDDRKADVTHWRVVYFCTVGNSLAKPAEHFACYSDRRMYLTNA